MIMLAAIGTVLGCGATSFAQNDNPDAAVSAAEIEIANGHFDAALNILNEVIKNHPDKSGAYVQRARAYFYQEKYDLSRTDASQAISLDPRNSRAFAVRGAIAYAKNDFASCIADCTKAIELNPSYMLGYYYRGMAYALQSNWLQALADLNKTIELDPKYLNGFVGRGFVYFSRGDIFNAIKDAKRAVELDPSNKLVQKNLDGYVKAASFLPETNMFIRLPVSAQGNETFTRVVNFINAGNFDAALKILDDVITADPKNANVFYLGGLIQYKLSNFKLARTEESAAIKLNPNVAEYYYLRGLTNLYDPTIWSIGEKRLAGSDFDMAIKLNSNYADAFRERAAVDFFWDGGDQGYGNQVYIRNLRRANDLNPKDGEAYFLEATFKIQKQDWEEVESLLTQAINLGNKRSQVYENRGYANVKLRNRPQAIADYQMAIAVNPHNATAIVNLNRLNSNQANIDLILDTPLSDPWASKMRELAKKLGGALYTVEDVSTSFVKLVNTSANRVINKDTGCNYINRIIGSLYSANSTSVELYNLSRSADDKKAYFDQSNNTAKEIKEEEQMSKSRGCS